MISKKKVKKNISKTGIEVNTIYCRRCMITKKYSDFFAATDLELDANGYFSICKDCCQEIYDNYYKEESDVARAILRTCRKLNVCYSEVLVEQTLDRLKKIYEKGKGSENIFSIYKAKLATIGGGDFETNLKNGAFTFKEPSIYVESQVDVNNIEDARDLKQYWGENLAYEDYLFLEREIADWKKTHKCDTKAEETLLKEICHKMLEIRKQRKANDGRASASVIKELQELMKTASLDPAKTSVANSGKAQETFSNIIKIIEETEPADYFKDKELFKDFDNIGRYFKKYVTRPLKNFVTQSRDFNVETDVGDDDLGIEDEDNESEGIPDFGQIGTENEEV